MSSLRSSRRWVPSVTWLASRSSWTRWRQSRATRRLARELERTQALLGLLAQREAKLQVALQLQGLTQEAQLLRVQELLADLSTPEQPPPPPELPSPETVLQGLTQELELPVMHRPEPLQEQLLPTPPPAEEQLWSQLGGPSSTAPSLRNSES